MQKKRREIKNTFSRFVEITDNDDKGIKEVLALSGYCEFSNNHSQLMMVSKYFELKVSESLIEDYKANPCS